MMGKWTKYDWLGVQMQLTPEGRLPGDFYVRFVNGNLPGCRVSLVESPG